MLKVDNIMFEEYNDFNRSSDEKTEERTLFNDFIDDFDSFDEAETSIDTKIVDEH
jgi:hypothetical protein